MKVQEVVRQIAKETGIMMSGACIRKYDNNLKVTSTRPREYSETDYIRLKQAAILHDIGLSPYKTNTFKDIQERIEVIQRSISYLKNIGRHI